MTDPTIIQKLDILDIIGFISKKNKKTQAQTLRAIEEIVTDKEDYQKIRKIVLDSLNNYTRSILKIIFGDIEDVIR